MTRAQDPLRHRREFLELLSAAEQSLAAGSVNEAHLELVRKLSDLASTPVMTQYLSIDRTIRTRWDAVFAATDPEVLRSAARSKMRDLVERGESCEDRDLVGIAMELRSMEKVHGLDLLYGDDPDLGDRADLLIQGWKESRLS